MEDRPLTSAERAVLDLLLSRELPGRTELVAQAASVRTGGSSCSCGCPSFSLIADRALPPAPVTQRMVSDAHGEDPGGNVVGVLLFVDDGYLSEVEVYDMMCEDKGFAGLPHADELTLSEWSEPNEQGTRWLQN